MTATEAGPAAGTAPSGGTRRPPLRGVRRSATIQDVAAASGVSRGTVSRVLNDGRYVSPEAREKVLAALHATGYVGNASARSLVTRRSGCVGLVFCEPEEQLFEDPNFSTIIRCCTQGFAEADLTLALLMAGEEHHRRRVIRSALSGYFDGLVVVPGHGGSALLAEFDTPQHLPVVVHGRPVGGAPDMLYVGADDRAGARTAVRHLLASGRRRVATVTGPLDTPAGADRLDSYRLELGDLAAPELVASSPEWSRRGGAEAMARLLEQAPDLDAVFVAADLMATGALETLREAGRSVPDDVAVVGFDDSPVALRTSPPLTTVRQPFDQLAREMVRLLVARIAEEDVGSVVLPTTLVRRGSA